MTMQEYFITANSFAAPFFSDSSSTYVEAASPEEALTKFAATYSHPCGLFSAAAYDSADAMHKGQKPRARWLSNRVLAEEKAKAGKGCYASLGISPDCFEIDGERFTVDDPKGGSVAPA